MMLLPVKRRLLKLVLVSILFLPMLVYLSDWWYKEQVISMKITPGVDRAVERMDLRNMTRAFKRMEPRNVDRAVKRMKLRNVDRAVKRMKPRNVDRAVKRMEHRNVDRAVKRMKLRNVDRAVKQMELRNVDRAVKRMKPRNVDRAVKRMELRNVDRAVKRMKPRNVDRAVKRMELPRAIAATGDTIRSNTSAVGVFFPPGSRPPITLSKGFVIENKQLCSKYVSLTYVVVVHTALRHFERRETFRKTWARSGTYNGTTSQTMFLIGRTLSKTLQQDILSENKKNGDIVQGDFIDDYSNLTLKAVMGLKWITQNCPNADYVIKVDDDVFINIFQAIGTVFPVLKANPKQVYCHIYPAAMVIRESAGKQSSKWFIPLEYFKGRKHYPMPFCFGLATFYTTTFASELLAMAESTPFYRLDDVYVYGILVSKIEGASWHNARNRYIHGEVNTSKLFLKRNNSLVGTVRSAAGMYHMWKSISAENRSTG